MMLMRALRAENYNGKIRMMINDKRRMAKPRRMSSWDTPKSLSWICRRIYPRT